MAHRLPPAGKPSPPTDSFRFHQVWPPPKPKCRNTQRHQNPCTLRQKFVCVPKQENKPEYKHTPITQPGLLCWKNAERKANDCHDNRKQQKENCCPQYNYCNQSQPQPCMNTTTKQTQRCASTTRQCDPQPQMCYSTRQCEPQPHMCNSPQQPRQTQRPQCQTKAKMCMEVTSPNDTCSKPRHGDRILFEFCHPV